MSQRYQENYLVALVSLKGEHTGHIKNCPIVLARKTFAIMTHLSGNLTHNEFINKYIRNGNLVRTSLMASR